MDEFTIYLPFPEPWDYIAIPVRLALVLVAPPIGDFAGRRIRTSTYNATAIQTNRRSNAN